MKLIRFGKKGADFVTNSEVDKFREYLETETVMPFDMIDLYVADFINKAKTLRQYYKWREFHYPDLPFKD